MKDEKISDDAALMAALTLKKYCNQHGYRECKTCYFRSDKSFCRVDCMPYSYNLSDYEDEKKLKEEL